MVDTDSAIPSRAYCSLCRLSGWWLAYFSTSIIARRLGPAKPRAIAWNGAGGWAIFSQLRQLNFSRTCSVTNHCRGMTSSVSVTSSPILESLLEPQHGHAAGAGWTIRRRGRSAGTLRRFAPREALHLDTRRLGLRLLLALGGSQLLELQFHLIDEPLAALGARTKHLALHLGDHQLQM